MNGGMVFHPAFFVNISVIQGMAELLPWGLR